MTSEERHGSALEIIQTRDVTRAEARRISHFATQAIFRQARRDPLYWIFRILGLGGIIVAIAIAADFLLFDVGVVFPTWGWFSLLMGLAAYAATISRVRNVTEQSNHQLHRAGTRYRITDNGLGIDRQGISAHFAWRSISALAEFRANVLVYIGLAQVAVLPKAACENQDVEGFCAELQRRWQAQRAPAGAAA